jgi:hypothetical protein
MLGAAMVMRLGFLCFVVLLFLAAAWLVVPAGATGLDTPSPDGGTTNNYYITAPTQVTCANGHVIGSAPDCPVFVLAYVPTPTVNPYERVGLAGNGNEYAIWRGFSYGEVLIASIVLVGVGVLALSVFIRIARGV